MCLITFFMMKGPACLITFFMMKGPTYREQNKNEEFCIDAVRVYRIKWAKNKNVDDRVLADWEHEVVTCIKNRL